MSKALPARPNLDYLRKLAKQRLKLLRAKDPVILLARAQLEIARDYGFASWRKLQAHVNAMKVHPEPSNDAIQSLQDAIIRGDTGAVRQLLDQHPSIINAPQSDGRTPLHAAAEHNHVDLVELLVAQGANLSATYGHSAHTPLSWAITVRSSAAVSALIRLGAPVDFYIAAGLGLLDRVQSYFDRHGHLKPNPSTNGSSRFAADGSRLPRPPVTNRELISDALYNAARSGHAGVVRFLLTHDPDLSFRSYIGGTLLHWACFSASTEVVRLLLDAGADPTLRDDVYRCTPRAFGICVAASWGILDLVRQQLKNDTSLMNISDGRGTPLHEAARSGSIPIVEFLLKAGADPSLRDAENKTARDLAIENKHTEAAELLKITSADIEKVFLKLAVPAPATGHKSGFLKPAADMLQQHPELRGASIHTACVTGSAADLKRFLEKDNSLANTVGGPWSWPPLCYLTFSRFLRDDKSGGAKFVRCAKLLLEAGADPNSFFPAPNDPNDRETALYGAAGVANNAPLTRLLLEAGADPNDPESLYHASEFSNNSALRVLLAAKLDPKWISYCMCHKMDMEDPVGLAMFIKSGADVNRLIEGGQMKGWRPLHFALFRSRSSKIIKLLLAAGADPNLPATNGTTAYKLARRLGHIESAELMLEHGATDDLTDTEKLLAALSAGDRRTSRRVMTADNSLARKLTSEDHKLLVDAAASGNLAAVRLMLDHGFPIETKGGTGGGWDGTALHHAAWNGRTAVVRLLLQRGANPLAKHAFGGNAMGAAIGASHAGHRNGVAIVKLVAPTMSDADLRKHLDDAKTEPNLSVVKALEQTILDREPREIVAMTGAMREFFSNSKNRCDNRLATSVLRLGSMKLRMVLIMLGSIAVLWVGLIAAAKWADHSLNAGRQLPTADSIIQGVSTDASTTLPTYWDVPTFSFPDQDGKRITDRNLRGHVWVADFIFTQCVTACPIMTSKMLLLQKQVHQPSVRFVSFSVDPEHDTSAVLKKYAELWHGDESRWRLLSTQPATLAAIVKAMRVTVEATADPDNPIMHSSLFLLVDANGHVRGIYDSIDSEATAQLAEDMKSLAGGSPTTIPTETAGGSAVHRGEVVYKSMGCLACHSQSRIAPPLASVFNGQVRLADHRTVWADEAYIHESIVDPNAKVVAGYLPTMPSYRNLLTDEQVVDLLAYVESLSTNPTGGHGVISTVAASQPEQELLTTDPVCKMEIHIDPSAPHAVFNGKTYYFCSDNCREKFLKNPSHFPAAAQMVH